MRRFGDKPPYLALAFESYVAVGCVSSTRRKMKHEISLRRFEDKPALRALGHLKGNWKVARVVPACRKIKPNDLWRPGDRSPSFIPLGQKIDGR